VNSYSWRLPINYVELKNRLSGSAFLKFLFNFVMSPFSFALSRYFRFYRASALYWYRNYVRPSVCPYDTVRYCIRNGLSSYFLQYTVALSLFSQYGLNIFAKFRWGQLLRSRWWIQVGYINFAIFDQYLAIRGQSINKSTRCWHVTISCQPDGRPPQPVRPWKSGRVHLAEGSN